MDNNNTYRNDSEAFEREESSFQQSQNPIIDTSFTQQENATSSYIQPITQDTQPASVKKSCPKAIRFIAIASFVLGFISFGVNLIFYFGLVQTTSQAMGMVIYLLLPLALQNAEMLSIILGLIATVYLLARRKRLTKIALWICLSLLGILFSFLPTILSSIQKTIRDNDPYFAYRTYYEMTEEKCASWQEEYYSSTDDDYTLAVDMVCAVRDYYKNVGDEPTSVADIESYAPYRILVPNDTPELATKLTNGVTFNEKQPTEKMVYNVIFGKTCKNTKDAEYVSV